MISDPVFYMFAIPAVLIAGIAKGGFSGLMVISVPIMSVFGDPRQGAAILLPVLCVMDLFSVWKFRGYWDVRSLRVMVPASILGVAIGAAAFRWLNVDGIRFIVGIIGLGFVAGYLLNQKRKPESKVPNRFLGYIWGGLAGFTSFSAHSGAAPASMYLLPQQLDKLKLASTFAVFFTILNYVKLVPYSLLGQLPLTNLGTSLALLPVGVLGIQMGFWLHSAISEKTYYQITYWLLLSLSLKLIYDAVSATFWPGL